MLSLVRAGELELWVVWCRLSFNHMRATLVVGRSNARTMPYATHTSTVHPQQRAHNGNRWFTPDCKINEPFVAIVALAHPIRRHDDTTARGTCICVRYCLLTSVTGHPICMYMSPLCAPFCVFGCVRCLYSTVLSLCMFYVYLCRIWVCACLGFKCRYARSNDSTKFHDRAFLCCLGAYVYV